MITAGREAKLPYNQPTACCSKCWHRQTGTTAQLFVTRRMCTGDLAALRSSNSIPFALTNDVSTKKGCQLNHRLLVLHRFSLIAGKRCYLSSLRTLQETETHVRFGGVVSRSLKQETGCFRATDAAGVSEMTMRALSSAICSEFMHCMLLPTLIF